MLVITPVSKDFALDMTFGSLVGEESGIPLICQFSILGYLFII